MIRARAGARSAADDMATSASVQEVLAWHDRPIGPPVTRRGRPDRIGGVALVHHRARIWSFAANPPVARLTPQLA